MGGGWGFFPRSYEPAGGSAEEVFRNEDQLSSSLHGKERNKKEKMKGKSGEG